GAPTQVPPCRTSRLAATRSASARRSWSRIETETLTRSLGFSGFEYQSVTITPPALSACVSGMNESVSRLARQRYELTPIAVTLEAAMSASGRSPPPQAERAIPSAPITRLRTAIRARDGTWAAKVVCNAILGPVPAASRGPRAPLRSEEH